MGEKIKLDGDESLRTRSSSLGKVLRDLQVDVDSDSLPVICKWKNERRHYRRSQPIKSAINCIDFGISKSRGAIEIHVEGDAVSRGYLGMTFDIARSCGCPIEMSSH